jgi:hypothetical protein
MPSSPSQEASVRAQRARTRLEIAGRALDPNGIESGPDPETARALLAGAAVDALGVLLSLPTGQSSTQIASALERTTELPKWDTELLRRLLDESSRPEVNARDAERVVARLVSRVDGRSRFAHRVRVAFFVVLGGALLTGVALLLHERLFPPQSDGYAWRTSSAYPGYPTSGKLRDRHGNLLFHTMEEAGPWIEIDAGKLVTMSAIDVTNRSDCCFERAVPLRVEVAGEDRAFAPVGTREDLFTKWHVRFPGREARYVRLSVPRTTILHLDELEIR